MAESGVNRVTLIGRLGQNPEVRYMPDGGAVANVSVATSEIWKDKNSGEQQEQTEWHRVVFFRRLAEVVGEYLSKGSKVYIEGKLKTQKWEDKNGETHYTTQIVARNMQMLDSKSGNQGQGGGRGKSQTNDFQNPQQQTNTTVDSGGCDFDDDIPFAPIRHEYLY